MKYVKMLEKKRIIRKSESVCWIPVRFLEKPDGGFRMVFNLIPLNDLVIKMAIRFLTEMKLLENTFMQVAFGYWLKKGFYNIYIRGEDKQNTAFEVRGQIYEFNGMVMEYKNSPVILQS